MPDLDPEISTLAVDTAIDGDAYMPGLANPVTSAEIQDIYMNNRNTVAERQQALTKLRQEMVARDAADTLPDTKALIAEIDKALGYLSEGGDGSADPDVLNVKDSAVNPDYL